VITVKFCQKLVFQISELMVSEMSSVWFEDLFIPQDFFTIFLCMLLPHWLLKNLLAT